MEKRFVYADNAATTPMSETAFNAMKPWLTENYGNPSSLYRIGRAAKEALNDARTVVGKCLNAAEPVTRRTTMHRVRSYHRRRFAGGQPCDSRLYARSVL